MSKLELNWNEVYLANECTFSNPDLTENITNLMATRSLYSYSRSNVDLFYAETEMLIIGWRNRNVFDAGSASDNLSDRPAFVEASNGVKQKETIYFAKMTNGSMVKIQPDMVFSIIALEENFRGTLGC